MLQGNDLPVLVNENIIDAKGINSSKVATVPKLFKNQPWHTCSKTAEAQNGNMYENTLTQRVQYKS
jgi:hypothetical protein